MLGLNQRLQSTQGTPEYNEFRGNGFRIRFRDDGEGGSPNQVRHFVGVLTGAYAGAAAVAAAPGAAVPILVARKTAAEAAYRAGLVAANAILMEPDTPSGRADMALNEFAVRAGVNLQFGLMRKDDLAQFIRNNLCE